MSGNERQPQIESAIEEYELACDARQPLAPWELIARYPDLADELLVYFANRGMVGQLIHSPKQTPAPVDARDLRQTTPHTRETGDDRHGALPAIPGYEVYRRLGRGGMGVVFLARHQQLDRLVALKLMRHEDRACDPEERARFLAEPRALASFQHPHIVAIHEVGEHQGQPYFSLEYAQRGSLADLLDENPLADREAATLLEILARALHAAHCKGIIHRDLKPANVLLMDDGIPKVTDFGLAKKVEEPGQTQTGAVMGTPPYMAPEQARGDSKRVGPTTDVYGLGAILYECLTGRPPFRAATALDTLRQVMADEPVPVRRLQPKVARDLETICHKCLRKEPRERYGTALDLADDLQRFLSRRPIKARRVGLFERTIKWARRRPGVATQVVFCIVLAAMGLGLSFFLHHQLLLQSHWQRERVQSNVLRVQIAATHIFAGRCARGERLLHDCPVEFRHWEWYFLQRVIQRNRIVLRNHQGPVNCVAFHPSQVRQVATGDQRGWVYLWDTGHEQPSCIWQAHTGEIVTACFTTDGRWLITAGRDQKVQLWDYTTTRKGTIPPSPAIPWDELIGERAVVNRQKPFRLATLDPNNNVAIVWDLDTREELARVTDERVLNDLALTPDGRYLVVCGYQGLLRVIAVEDPKRIRSNLMCSPNNIWAVATSPDGTLLAAGTSPPTICDIESGEPVGSDFGIAKLTASRLTFSRTGASGRPLVAVAYREGLVRAWEVGSGRLLKTLPRKPGLTRDLKFDPRGRYLALTRGNKVALEMLVPNEVSRNHPLPGHAAGQEFAAVAFSGNGSYVAAHTGKRELCVWRINASRKNDPEGMLLHRLTLDADTDPRTNLAFSPNSQLLACGSQGQQLLLWDVPSGKIVRTIPAGGVRCLGFRDDGKVLATSDGSTRVLLWDLRPATFGKLLHTLSEPEGITTLAFRPRSNQLVTCGEAGSMYLWDTDWGKRLHTIGTGPQAITAVAFRPDGREFATTGTDKRVKIWNPDTGKSVRIEPIDLAGPTFDIAYTPKGQRLAVCDWGGTVSLWDPHHGLEVLTLSDHGGPTTGIAFAPSGWLATCSRDGTVRLWDGRRSASTSLP
jgi:WD40 repeat protein